MLEQAPLVPISSDELSFCRTELRKSLATLKRESTFEPETMAIWSAGGSWDHARGGEYGIWECARPL